jgi:hypothetical protein
MFDHPLQIPHQTVYDALGIGADGGDLIREFLMRETNRVSSQLRRVRKSLVEAGQRVPGYEEAKARLTQLESSDRADAELRALHDTVRSCEVRLLALCPEFKAWESEKDSLERRLNDLNNSPLHVPEKREAYNRTRPPLSLMAVEAHDARIFTDKKTVLARVRGSVTTFLQDKALDVTHPSDLDRTDFSHDFEENSVLDGEPMASDGEPS